MPKALTPEQRAQQIAARLLSNERDIAIALLALRDAGHEDLAHQAETVQREMHVVARRIVERLTQGRKDPS